MIKRVRQRILLVGYYGYENAGDDMLLARTVSLVCKRFPGSKIRILWPGKKAPDLYYYVPRFSFPAVVWAIFRSQRIVYGGGSIFQDASSFSSVAYYAILALLARFMGKKSYILGHGMGPLNARKSRLLVRWALSCFEAVSLRDEESLALIRDIGSLHQRVILASDLGFYGVKPTPVEFPREAVGISFRPYCHMAAHKEVLREFFNSLEEPGVFFCCQSPLDETAFDYLRSQLTVDAKLQKEAVFPFLIPDSGSGEFPVRTMIGMRYHACVMAAMYAVPFLGLGYDEKVIALCRQLGQEWVDLRQPKLELADLIEKWRRINAGYVEYQRKLIQGVSRLAELSERNEEVFDG